MHDRAFMRFAGTRLRGMLSKWWLILLIICHGACFEVPTEWRAAIQKICRAAEKSVFLHPSSDTQ